MILWHCSPAENAASIMSVGLDPARSREAAFRERSVYLAADAFHALAYAEGDCVLFEVDTEKLDPSLLGPDDVDLPDLVGEGWREMDWRASLQASGQCSYAGIIPTAALRIAEAPAPAGRAP